MAKAEVSTAVLLAVSIGVGVLAIYTVYEVSKLTREAGAAAQKPFRWFAEGSEFWADTVTFWDNPRPTEKDGNTPVRKWYLKDEGSWGWGYGPEKGWLLG